MEKLIRKLNRVKRKLNRLRRKKAHLSYMKGTLVVLKYQILNEALRGNINENKIYLFHKYQKRFNLITFLK